MSENYSGGENSDSPRGPRGDREGRDGRDERGPGGRRGGFLGGTRRRKKACPFCHDKGEGRITYKSADRLKRFLSDRGKIVPRRAAGTCAKHQRYLTTLIKRARFMALLPYVTFERTREGGREGRDREGGRDRDGGRYGHDRDGGRYSQDKDGGQ